MCASGLCRSLPSEGAPYASTGREQPWLFFSQTFFLSFFQMIDQFLIIIYASSIIYLTTNCSDPSTGDL